MQFFFIISLLLAYFSFTFASTPKLGQYKISDVTVSGISSGGYMAVQTHVALSKIINGASIFAGGPYYCAQGSVYQATHVCMNPNDPNTVRQAPDVGQLVTLTMTNSLTGYIDENPQFNMSDDHLYIFSGSLDSVVDKIVVESLVDYYRHFVPSDRIVTEFNIEGEHCWPTNQDEYGEECEVLSSPYIGKCNFDGAKITFQTLYGEDGIKNGKIETNKIKKGLNSEKVEKENLWYVNDNLLEFNQDPFIPYASSTPPNSNNHFETLFNSSSNSNFSNLLAVGATSGIGSKGYVYVPTSCQNGETCHLHISFHGCLQNLELIGNSFAAYSGLNEWAENNNIIVLYPYISPSSAAPVNPNGCWDWWGYTDYLYGAKQGIQLKFVRNLINHISNGKI